MTFEEGKVTFYGQDVLIIPYIPIMEYMAQISNDTESTKIIYSMTKEAMLENREGIIKVYKASGDSDWICNTINLFGQGKIKYENSATEPIGVIILENSISAKDIKYTTKYPIDHILRGIIAGIVSVVLDKDIDAIETMCCATGSSNCKFFIATKEDIENKFAILYKQQIYSQDKSSTTINLV
jgi:predicted hydrocarbon binding protein